MKIVILGITGSIGSQTAKICQDLGFKIVGCSYHTNHTLAKKLIKTHHIKNILCTSQNNLFNCENYDELIKKSKPNLVVNAIIGFTGLKATISTLKNKINLALANKESCVVAGKLIFDYAKKHNLKIIPIDSEHTNLYKQLLEVDQKKVNQIYITCSGGKYLNWTRRDLKKVSWLDATSHKNWSMGNKITIDSNTLMNKCFEVIEAFWYFKASCNVLLDQTSTIHSAILMDDGTFLYSHSLPTMQLPICWAINGFKAPNKYYKSSETQTITPVLSKINNIEPIKWAYEVINDKTNSLGIVLNTANELAIELFKQKKITFDQIIPYIKHVKNITKLKKINNLSQIFKFVDELKNKLVK